jgi:hypothetical protein
MHGALARLASKRCAIRPEAVDFLPDVLYRSTQELCSHFGA